MTIYIVISTKEDGTDPQIFGEAFKASFLAECAATADFPDGMQDHKNRNYLVKEVTVNPYPLKEIA